MNSLLLEKKGRTRSKKDITERRNGYVRLLNIPIYKVCKLHTARQELTIKFQLTIMMILV